MFNYFLYSFAYGIVDAQATIRNPKGSHNPALAPKLSMIRPDKKLESAPVNGIPEVTRVIA